VLVVEVIVSPSVGAQTSPESGFEQTSYRIGSDTGDAAVDERDDDRSGDVSGR
jgi:hypothetical protein